ncbi:MAG: HU family DNA-binding protein [Planctomycetota bacterium]
MTKRELVNRIADETGQTKVVVRDVLQRFLDSVIDELAVGNRLEFRDFGVFEVRERAARVAQNPRTLEKVPVPAKRVVKFKVGRVMRQRVCDELEPAARSGAASNGSGRAGVHGAGPSFGAGSPEAGKSVGADRNGAAEGAGSNGVNGSGHEDGRQAPSPPPTKPGSPF